ncbi:hypothetical protein C8Q77DRAFT_51910 [Trametes polyzona]|nr:hypothetical protein C8Q77DRAFT_51910 [Trametes polyzona]
MDGSKATSEMVKLLLDELESVRARNRELRDSTHAGNRPAKEEPGTGPNAALAPDTHAQALQEKNAQLVREVEAARNQLAQVADASRSPEHDHDQGHQRRTHSQGAIPSGSASVPGTGIESEDLSRKVSRAREKYAQYQGAKLELEKAIADIRVRLREVKSENKDVLQRLDALQSELEDKTAAALPFVPMDFLSQPTTGSNEPREPNLLAAGVSASATALRKALAKLCVSTGWAMRRTGEVVWPTAGAEGQEAKPFCVFVSATHRYNPAANGAKGGWEPSWDLNPGEGDKDLFYLEAKKWYYAGTYRRVGQAILPSSQIKELLHPHGNAVLQRAISVAHLVPPVVMKTMNNMFHSGALKVVCTGWRRVGFNQRLAEALQPGRAPPIGPDGVDIVPGPQDNSEAEARKRKREGSSGTSKKMRKA